VLFETILTFLNKLNIMKKILVTSLLLLIFLVACKDEGPEPLPPVPVVQITSLSGTVNIIDSTMVEIGASDDKGVIRVELYINNSLDSSRIFLNPPYRWAWNVKNLTDSSLYTLFARAYDADGNVSTSPIVVARILRFAPNSLVLTFANDTAAVLTWNNPGSIASGFEVEQSRDGVNFSSRMTVGPDTARAVVVGEYLNDSSYYFRIRALMGTTKSAYTNIVGEKIQFLPPQNLRVTYMDEDSATVEWDDPRHLAQGYTIWTCTDGIHYSKVPIALPSGARMVKIGNTYQTIKTYYFKMYALSNINLSTVSSITTGRLDFPAPDSLVVTSVTNDAVRLHWRDNASFGSFFEVEFKLNNGPFQPAKAVPKESTYATFHFSYQTFNKYSFRVYLRTNLNTTTYSDTVMTFFQDELFAGGSFTGAGSQTVNNVAKWDGSAWTQIGDGAAQPVYVLHKFNERLFAGGKQLVTAWNGSNWVSVGTLSGVNDYVYSLTDSNGKMMVGGAFNTLGGAKNGVGLWQGSYWEAMGWGMENGILHAVTYYKTYFVAGGNFTTANSKPIQYIARYNNGWDSLGHGLPGPVYALKVYNGDLYAGGFYTDSVNNFQSLAKWNGTAWSSVTGLGVGSIDSVRVYAMEVYNNELYVGGRFSSINGVGVNNIAKWNGFTWQPVASGVDGVVRALFVKEGVLYIGGKFTSAGGVPVNNIALWTNSDGWAALGNGVTGTKPIVYALSAFGTWHWKVVQ